MKIMFLIRIYQFMNRYQRQGDSAPGTARPPGNASQRRSIAHFGRAEVVVRFFLIFKYAFSNFPCFTKLIVRSYGFEINFKL